MTGRAPAFEPGDRVGRYRVVGALGRGGMASVWEVEDAGGKRFALKSPEARLDPFTVARFQREMRALRTLRHDNLVAAIDTFVDGDYVFLVMERVVGTSLAAVIAEGALPAAHAVAIAKQILAGIGHAHAHGYVHRDLKPDNILLVGDRVKVIDFGLCKPMEPSPEDDLGPMTTRGTVFGSPPYMSPEQALGKQLDGRSDLYAIGIILYEMLAGVPPFDDPAPAMTMRMHVTHRVPPIVATSVGKSLQLAVMTALAKPPQHRFADAAAMIAALDNALAIP
jgi:serine/threonine-protein kinase|nr:serine/threonine-protein kinase [Kofleriaceae bacterium]